MLLEYCFKFNKICCALLCLLFAVLVYLCWVFCISMLVSDSIPTGAIECGFYVMRFMKDITEMHILSTTEKITNFDFYGVWSVQVLPVCWMCSVMLYCCVVYRILKRKPMPAKRSIRWGMNGLLMSDRCWRFSGVGTVLELFGNYLTFWFAATHCHITRQTLWQLLEFLICSNSLPYY